MSKNPKDPSNASVTTPASFATEVLESVVAGHPQPTSLSGQELEAVAILVATKAQNQFQNYGNQPLPDFTIDTKSIDEALEAFADSDDGIRGRPAKKKQVVRVGKRLAKGWQSYIRNSELLKLIKSSAELISRE